MALKDKMRDRSIPWLLIALAAGICLAASTCYAAQAGAGLSKAGQTNTGIQAINPVPEFIPPPGLVPGTDTEVHYIKGILSEIGNGYIIVDSKRIRTNGSGIGGVRAGSYVKVTLDKDGQVIGMEQLPDSPH